MRSGDAEVFEETAQCLLRRYRRTGGVATQVGIQLAAGEARPDSVCPVQGERGLADAGGSGDGCHGHDVRFIAAVRYETAEADQLPGAVDEVAYVAAELAGYNGRDGQRLLVEVHPAVDLTGLHDTVRRSRAPEPVDVASAVVHP